jgi:hypothetical protein
MPDSRSGHLKNKASWTFDYDVPDSEGLTLLNGSFLGVRIFDKLSLPVIRVKYLVDEAAVPSRRKSGSVEGAIIGGVVGGIFGGPAGAAAGAAAGAGAGYAAAGNGAGPFADQIRWVLEGTHGLQRIANRNNEYVGIHEYEVNNVYWIEICVYARIGAYHIAQQWHLSHLGHILPRVWSKGLTINQDHTHHPYWRFDFDFDGHANNRVWAFDGASWKYYPVEANDTKVPGGYWFVRNERTNNGAWIFPGKNDGHADAFSSMDLAVRRYDSLEGLNPWRFGTGELGDLNGEPVANDDVVCWYVAHLFHRASEGGDHWHWAGPTVQVHLS